MKTTDQLLKLAEAYKKMKEAELDPVGQADADIDNDGDVDSSDKYLHKRRKAIKKAMSQDESSCGKMKKEEVEEVDEAKYGDTGWKRTKGQRKDQYGNTVKNVAKHLAKQGAKTAETQKEDADLFSDAEIERLEEMGVVFEKKDAHTKGATAPEGIMDKESPKSKEFAAAHDKSDKEFEDKVYASHKDSVKAGAPAVKQSPARSGDKLNNGDSKQPPKVQGAPK